jgi:hypothetical protein
MHSARKDVQNVEEIFGKFGFWGLCRIVENHDLPTGSLNQMLDEVKAESSKSVFVGNHNSKLFSLQRSFQ